MPEMAGLDEGTPLFTQIADRLAAEIANSRFWPRANGCRPPTNWPPSTGSTRPPRPRASTCSPTTGSWKRTAASACSSPTGARQRLLGQRREQFTERYLRPLLTEATRLGIDAGELIELISDFARQQAGNAAASPARGGVLV